MPSDLPLTAASPRRRSDRTLTCRACGRNAPEGNDASEQTLGADGTPIVQRCPECAPGTDDHDARRAVERFCR